MREGEKILDFYNCAFKSSILLIQGHMYVTNLRLFFFSMFNDKDFATFLGSFFGMGEPSQTAIEIMLEDIEQIFKCTNALLLNFSLGIRLKKGKKLMQSGYMLTTQEKGSCYGSSK